MAGKPVARLGDPGSHGGKIITGASSVLVNNKPVARIGDLYGCGNPKHPPNPITSGSKSVIAEGQSMAHVDSKTACGANIIQGSPDVFIGDNVVMTNIPQIVAEQYFSEQFRVVNDDTGEPIADAEYIITTESGSEYRGVTGSDGMTMRVYTDAQEEITLELV